MKTLFTLILCAISVFSIAKNKTYICLKDDGSEAFKIEAKYVYNFNEGLARVKISEVIENKWVSKIGFINVKGEIVIPCKYDKVKGKGFVNGRAWVKNKTDKYWTLIDTTGKVIPTGNYDKVSYISKRNEGLLCVYQGDYLGFIDINGNEIIPCKYIGGTTFYQGLVCVTIEDGEVGYGWMNRAGEIVIPMKFKQAGTSSFMENGMCRAGVNGRTVLIDKTGKIVFETRKGNIQGISNGWIRVFTNNDRTGWGYINFKEEWMIDPNFSHLKEFNDYGMAAAAKNDLWGIIDTSGTTIMDFKYGTLYFEPQKDGYIMGAYPMEETTSLMKTPKDYFKPDFTPVDMTGIKYIYPADGGKLMPYQADNGSKGYLNRDFEVVVPAKYSRADSFVEGLAWVVQ